MKSVSSFGMLKSSANSSKCCNPSHKFNIYLSEGSASISWSAGDVGILQYDGSNWGLSALPGGKSAMVRGRAETFMCQVDVLQGLDQDLDKLRRSGLCCHINLTKYRFVVSSCGAQTLEAPGRSALVWSESCFCAACYIAGRFWSVDEGAK